MQCKTLTNVHGKEFLRQCNSIKNTGENLTLNKIFEISEQLTLEQSDEIFGVSQISWESSPWKRSSRVDDEEVISLSHAKFYVFSDSVFMSWKDESEPNIKYCLGATVGMVQRFITKKNFGDNRRGTDGIRVEYIPRIRYIGACP